MSTFNWNMEQHKAYAAEQERRARKHQQAQEVLKDKDEDHRSSRSRE